MKEENVISKELNKDQISEINEITKMTFRALFLSRII